MFAATFFKAVDVVICALHYGMATTRLIMMSFQGEAIFNTNVHCFISIEFLQPYLCLEGRDIFPSVGVWVVALHRVQFIAVVPPSDGKDIAAHHADTVVSTLLLQRCDRAPAVVARVISGKSRQV